MKKITVVLAVLLLLALSQVSQAVSLQTDWYVKLGGVGAFGTSPDQQEWGIDWTFSGGLGTYGQLQVSNPDAWWPQRLVSVLPQSDENSSCVYLFGLPNEPINYPITSVVFRWETNYDASKMRLELLMYHPDYGYTLLWSQDQSGFKESYTNVLSFPQTIPVGYQPVFRVAAVPEPSGLFVLITGAGIIIGYLKREKR